MDSLKPSSVNQVGIIAGGNINIRGNYTCIPIKSNGIVFSSNVDGNRNPMAGQFPLVPDPLERNDLRQLTNGDNNLDSVAKEQIREMKSFFLNSSHTDSSTASPLKFKNLLETSHNAICQSLPAQNLLPLVRDLQGGLGQAKVLTDVAAEAILQPTLTPYEQKDRLLQYLKNDPREVVCRRFLDGLGELKCYGVLETLHKTFVDLKHKRGPISAQPDLNPRNKCSIL